MKAKLIIIGDIEVVEDIGENYKTQYGLVIECESPDQIREAIAKGAIEFTFGDESCGDKP
jgi:hypothetical protein